MNHLLFLVLGDSILLWAFIPFDATSRRTDVSSTLQIALCTGDGIAAVIGRLMMLMLLFL
jgi:hypothetical protein